MNEDKWYSGKYDRAFKEVMLKESNRDLLTMLLEHILKVKIVTIDILNVENLMSNVHIRSQRLDLNLETNVGKINVEVNSMDESYIHNRNFAFIADLYSHDVLVGSEYDLTKQFIQINLSYGLSKKKEKIDIYKLSNNKGNTYVDNFTIYNINMDYYINLLKDNDTKKIKDDIILVMLGQERNELEKLAKNNKVVSKYMNELDEVNKNPEFRVYMTKEEDDRKMMNTLINRATKQGIQEGIEQAKLDVTHKLLNTDMSISEISTIVDLPEEKILEIKNS